MDKSSVSSSPVTGIVQKFSERVPYCEGATRRRLLAGIIVALTIWGVSGHDVTALLTGEGLNTVFSHPLPSVAFSVGLYLLGTMVELAGNTSIVRAAGEAIFAVSGPERRGASTSFCRPDILDCSFGVWHHLPSWIEDIVFRPF